MESSPAPFDLAAISAGLPFAASINALHDAARSGACVVSAPPGSGKTTIAPPAIANLLAADARTGRVLVTAPRRVVVRAGAHRLAHLSNTHVGELAGYRVRGDSQVSAQTRVEFLTPGVLIRQLLADPELTGVDAVLLDEVHERGLDGDLLLGMLKDVRELRDDLLLIAMSATLDADRFAALLETDDTPAPLVSSPEVLHPLTTKWAPFIGARMDEFGPRREFLDHVARTTADEFVSAYRANPATDGLVFLPGIREVAHVARALTAALPNADVLTLHGQLSAAEQDDAIRGRGEHDRPRIVVSTPLAESALTVPGVRLVVDAGLVREPRRDIARDMSGLVTVATSRASAIQRAGRAARQGPGTVVRCYDEQTFARMPEHVTPEIATADLTDAALLLAAWGTPGGQGLSLPSPPPAAALTAASETLRGLGALDADGRITDLGRALVDIPTDARLARALLLGTHQVGAERAAEVVAALADSPRATDANATSLLRQLRRERPHQWATQTRRLKRIAAGNNKTIPHTSENPFIPTEYADAFVIAMAYPTRVARRVGGPDTGIYRLASGTRAALPSDSALPHDEWIVVAEIARTHGRSAQGTGAIIRLAAPFTRELAEQAAGHLVTKEVRATWNAQTGKVSGRQVHALGAIEFSSTPTKPTPQAAHIAILDALRTDGLDVLCWNDEATALRQRMAFIHHHLTDPWPDVSDLALGERLDEWLGPEIERLARGAKTASVSLAAPLHRLLPWPQASMFDVLAPERLQVPSGSRMRLQYPSIDAPGEPVVCAVKLQECFGLAETPRLADGRAPVLFHLLSPAGRPLAITDDLASFWSGPYAGVRSDMRGRYPKHPWPEDPWNHVATAKTNKRLNS